MRLTSLDALRRLWALGDSHFQPGKVAGDQVVRQRGREIVDEIQLVVAQVEAIHRPGACSQDSDSHRDPKILQALFMLAHM